MNQLTVFSNQQTFADAQRMAKALVSSTLVPEHFRGEQNMGNALIALELSQRMDMSPMAVLQSLYVVHGRPAFSAQFLIASWNACGRFTPIQYEQVGEEGKPSFGYRAVSKLRETGERIEGPAVTMAIANADGWSKRNPKYQSMPDLMLRYRAATWLVRSVAPELSMGFQTVEEAQDIPTERNITPQSADVAVDALNAVLAAPQDGPAHEPQRPRKAPEEPQEARSHDARGVPYNERFHSGSRALNSDGTWRLIRGCDTDALKRWEDSLREAERIPEPEPGLYGDPVDESGKQPGPALDYPWFVEQINKAKSLDDLAELRATFIDRDQEGAFDDLSKSMLGRKFDARERELQGGAA